MLFLNSINQSSKDFQSMSMLQNEKKDLEPDFLFHYLISQAWSVLDEISWCNSVTQGTMLLLSPLSRWHRPQCGCTSTGAIYSAFQCGINGINASKLVWLCPHRLGFTVELSQLNGKTPFCPDEPWQQHAGRGRVAAYTQEQSSEGRRRARATGLTLCACVITCLTF